MGYIGVNTLFNGFILGLVLSIANSFISNKFIADNECFLVGYVISAILTIIGYTKLAGNITGLFLRGRQPIKRELDKIKPLMLDVIERANNKFQTQYKYEDFIIKINDSMDINASALGYNTIFINRGALETLTDSQLRAILAHELGHLYFRDSVRLIALIFGSFGTTIIMWCYTIYSIIHSIFESKSGESPTGIVYLLGFIPLLMLLPVVVLNWIGIHIFNFLNLMMSRKAEYRADAFASLLGYKAETIELLEIFSHTSISDNSFLGKLMSTHPAPMLRIGAIEDNELQKQYFGTFKASTELINDGVSTKNSKELGLLSLYLLLLGSIFVVFAIYTKEQSKSNQSNQKINKISSTTNIHHATKTPKQHNVLQQGYTLQPQSDKSVQVESDNDKIHIIIWYFISKSRYTITYEYKGVRSVAIVHHQPPNQIMITREQFNALK